MISGWMYGTMNTWMISSLMGEEESVGCVNVQSGL